MAELQGNPRGRQIPIIAITAYGDFFRERARAAGFRAYFTKPIRQSSPNTTKIARTGSVLPSAKPSRRVKCRPYRIRSDLQVFRCCQKPGLSEPDSRDSRS